MYLITSQAQAILVLPHSEDQGMSLNVTDHLLEFFRFVEG